MPTPVDHREHQWSGWPGAFCLRCGAEDVAEICATTHAHADLDPERGICVVPCQNAPCPVSGQPEGEGR
jgi:hypothetical protein